nr:immunoglobulin light chain junction region [Macaca mulatta]MOW52731.1 immunoglobulin light chain junction region [Macaca mulatta]MOW53413.1 immunoglobulin light chain junction region [Macaca mulatta]MOW53474.1 immunoglobulin light chain junction region [Macaca mulatta]MOW54194.1 immunoglobulin light chain junction region [Macaca mulatta]
CLQDVQLPWTF